MKFDAILTPSAHVKGRLALYNRLTATDKEEILDLVAIKDSRTGVLCNMIDSTGARLRDVTIYGKSTQDGTPADAHVDIVSVGEDGAVTITTENADATQSTTATITSNLPLRGVKVSSGGNYTDASGQMWVCDSIEKYADGTGKYVQRIEEITLDGSEQWVNAAASTGSYFTCRIGDLGTAVLGVGMCTHFERTTITSATTTIGFDVNESTLLKRTQIAIRPNLENIPNVKTFTAWLAENPTTVIYALAEPIETPLTAEEVKEFEKLYSFFPLTNVYNSDGADMAVTYICDTKTYIDNRLEELQTAVAALV